MVISVVSLFHCIFSLSDKVLNRKEYLLRIEKYIFLLLCMIFGLNILSKFKDPMKGNELMEH